MGRALGAIGCLGPALEVIGLGRAATSPCRGEASFEFRGHSKLSTTKAPPKHQGHAPPLGRSYAPRHRTSVGC